MIFDSFGVGCVGWEQLQREPCSYPPSRNTLALGRFPFVFEFFGICVFFKDFNRFWWIFDDFG